MRTAVCRERQAPTTRDLRITLVELGNARTADRAFARRPSGQRDLLTKLEEARPTDGASTRTLSDRTRSLTKPEPSTLAGDVRGDILLDTPVSMALWSDPKPTRGGRTASDHRRRLPRSDFLDTLSLIHI